MIGGVDTIERSRASSAIQSAIEVLRSQRAMLEARGVSLERHGLSDNLAASFHSEGSQQDAQWVELFATALNEISARQKVLDAGTVQPETIDESIVACAVHKIRTNLDVALGSADEVGEISCDEVAVKLANDAVCALRLIYHYTNELSDLATLNSLTARRVVTEVDGVREIECAVQELKNVARDAGVTVEIALGSEPAPVVCDAVMVGRTIRRLLLAQMLSSGVTRISCSASLGSVDAGSGVVFRFEDDGTGDTLEHRAQSSMLEDAANPEGDGPSIADSAGFAAARRLSRGLGGTIELEMSSGSGTVVKFFVPSP